MHVIVLGTTNPAKKQLVQAALAPLDVVVRGTDDLGIAITVEEDGATAQENARKKSLAYARAAGRPVLSIDNALSFTGLPNEEQPGVNTRAVPGVTGRATNEELLRHYTDVIQRLGSSIDGHWEFAFCIADTSGSIVERTVLSARRFVSAPTSSRIPGFPLESIQIDPKTGRYIADMTSDEQDAFWQEIVGRELCDFVSEARSMIPDVLWEVGV